MKKSFILLLLIFGMITNVNATHVGGDSLLGSGVREKINPCHAFVIETWFSGIGYHIADGRGIMAHRKNASKFGFTVDDLLYISMMSVMDHGLAYKESLRICGLYDK